MITQVTTERFSYKDRVFAAQASDFGSLFDGLFGPVGYPPEIEGFELVSHITGRVVKMILVAPYFDGERDLTHWEFIPYNCDLFDSLIIFND